MRLWNNNFSRALFVLSAVLFSRTAQVQATDETLVEKGGDYFKRKFQHAIHKKKNEKVAKLIRDYLGNKISLKALMKIAKSEHAEELQHALSVANTIHPTANRLGIRRSELAQAALFIETKLPKLAKKKKYYHSSKKTGLYGSVEYDPESKLAFIHLDGRHGTKIGEGYKKKVSKSILYRPKAPVVIAQAKQRSNMKKEMHISKMVQDKKGIVRMYAFTKHKEKGKKCYSIMSKLYRPGSLRETFDKRTKFTLREKMHIAHNLVSGLYELHKRGIVHRDLGSRNYLINIPKKPKGHRKISAVVADLGRAEFYSKLANTKVQGNTSYTCPEGLYRWKMKGKDYLAADVYALGCVLYQLFHEKRTPWAENKYVKDKDRPVKTRYRKLVHKINRYRESRNRDLWKKKTKALTSKQRFERLILNMINPSPKKRCTTKELKDKMERILAENKQA